MLLVTEQNREATFAVVLMTTDAQLRERGGRRRLLWHPLLPAPEHNSLKWKPSKRALKNCENDAEMYIPTIMAPGRAVG